MEQSVIPQSAAIRHIRTIRAVLEPWAPVAPVFFHSADGLRSDGWPLKWQYDATGGLSQAGGLSSQGYTAAEPRCYKYLIDCLITADYPDNPDSKKSPSLILDNLYNLDKKNKITSLNLDNLYNLDKKNKITSLNLDNLYNLDKKIR